MFFVSEIPHLKVYRQRAMLESDKRVPSMYGMVFMNTNALKDSIDIMNNKQLFDNNKYHIYYIDNKYNGRLLSRTYRRIITKEREGYYEEINKGNRFIRPEKTLTTVNKRNMYYDMFYYNQIFFEMLEKKMMTYRKKTEHYLDYLKEKIQDDRLSVYKKRVVVTHVDGWLPDITTNLRKNTRTANPILFIYFAMFKMHEKLKELGDVDLIFYSENKIIRLNPSLIDKESYRLFRREISKLNSKALLEDDEQLESMLAKDEIVDEIASKITDKYNFTGTTDNDVDEKIADEIKDKVSKLTEKNKEVKSKEELAEKVSEEIDTDTELIKNIQTIQQEKKVGKSTVSSKRDEELRNRQKSIKVENKTIEDILSVDSKSITLESNDVSDKVSTTNQNVTNIKYPSFEKIYNEKLYKKDILDTINALNTKSSIPVFIRNIDVVDSSDELNYVETYTVDLEDSNRVRHRLKFDLPKFIDDKFMYLNGNKKIINKQLYMKPIVKTGPNEVQVLSSYNKIFITRHGAKISDRIEKFKKVISSGKLEGVVVKYGNNLTANKKYRTTIEFDELAKDYSYIRIGKTEFYFNLNEVTTLVEERKLKVAEGQICIGFINKTDPIYFNLDEQDADDLDLVGFILAIAKNQKFAEEFDSTKVGKKFIYSRAKIMDKNVPIILLLGYVEGLSTVLRKAKIKHYFTDTRPKLDHNQGSVQFSDGYIVYDKYPFENSLLMNAFSDIPTRAFTYSEFDDKSTYLDIFDTMFSQRNIGNAFDNFYDWLIDPIMKEVLTDLNYPTEFVEVILFANALLTDNYHMRENNMNLYRVRSNEIISAFLYKEIAVAYGSYRNTASNNNPVKISIPKDTITKKVLMAQTIEDYSILNPIVELEKSRAITPKGPSGMNLAQAYTQDKRSYDETMMGILAMSTSPDANCGIVRQLTMEPNIIGPRGYIELKNDDLDALKDVNLFSPAEMLSPLGVSRDDSIRTAMATKQSKHIIPIERSSPVLISNGAEQVIHYHISDDFSVVAKHDGVVVEKNEATGIMVIEYTEVVDKVVTKKYQAVDLSPRIVKNGAGGFHLSNKMVTKYKVGDKFKKNDIVASDDKFFSESILDGNRFNIGSLQKIAVMGSYSTYEDSTMITKKLTKDLASDIVMSKPVVLGKNANVDHIVKIGDKVKVGDELLRFETSFEDDSLNKFLDSIGEELKEEIQTLGKTPIKSKYSGEIIDIKIYSTVDLDELSPSLRKIVSDYYAGIKKKHKVLDKYDKSKEVFKMGVLLNEPTDKIEAKNGKVKGHEVGEGVLVEIFIQYKDIMGIGDKLTFFTALKSIIGEVLPEGLEPYSETRPEEEISSVIAPGAILARMTPSILLTMFGNKVLVELKHKLRDIYEDKT